jgi:signal transduction histidine kinase
VGAYRLRQPPTRRVVGFGALCGSLVALNLWLGIDLDARPWPFLASDVALGACFAAAGLAAWRLRPRSRSGPLMLILGVALLVANPYGFVLPATTPGYRLIMLLTEPAYWLQFAIAGHLLLSYPSGRLRHKTAEHRLITLGYLLALAGSVVTVVVRPGQGGDPQVYFTIRAAVMVAWIGLAVVAAGLLVRRVALSPSRVRRREAFALTAAGLTLLLFAVLLLTILGISGGSGDENAAALLHAGMAWSVVIAVPVAFFAGLLRERLAFASVGDLVRRLEGVGAETVETALGETLHDPTLRVVFPTPAGLLDVAGRRYVPPTDGSRSLTPLGEPQVAVLVHDPALTDDRELLQAAATAARLALDNARLYAEVRAQLAEVNASRQRIVTAADAERRRLERDLHDGAQQRLLGIGFTLGLLRRRLTGSADRDLVDELERDLRAAITELRDFAHGIRPVLLTDQGLAPALCELARRARLRVSLDVRLTARLDPVVEATAYYVVSEALQNVVKYTNDARVCVSALQQDGRLILEITDDGPGGASTLRGSGLRGLGDRVSAVGGRFDVDSPPGGGTTVRARLPCA